MDKEIYYYRRTLNYKVPKNPELGAEATKVQREAQRKIDEAEPLPEEEIGEREALLTQGKIILKNILTIYLFDYLIIILR